MRLAELAFCENCSPPNILLKLYLPASILAKVHRDELMVKLAQEFPMYDWHSNAGYGTKKHYAGIEKHGITEHHRAKFIH